jgi:hypothetical protein
MDMAEYLKENNELAQKIKKREFHPRDIQAIVKEYNLWYSKKQ